MLLLPLMVTGKKESATTENWENDESYTLHREDSTHLPRNYGSPEKVSLAGPYDKSTTEDPILPLILRKLIEDGLNNELDDEGNKKKTTEKTTGSKTPSFPLAYMTPPAVLISPSSKSAMSSEEDDEIISTTIGQDSSGEITTTDSSEIDDFDTTTPLPLPAMKFVVNSNNNNQWGQDDDTMKNNMNPEQYAPKFQKYYVPKISPSTETIQEIAATPESEAEDASPQSQTQPEEPDSDRLSGREDEDLDQSSTTVTPENQDEQGQNMTPPPPMTESDRRPVYYFFLRPKSRNPMFPSDMSNDNNDMVPTPPRSFNEDMPYRFYPQQQQGMMMNYPTRVYKFPSFIAQDYESQQQTVPSSYNSLSPPYYNNYNSYPSPMGSSSYPQYYYFQQRSQPMNPYVYPQRGNPYMSRQSPMFSPIPYNDISRIDQFNNNAGDNYYYRGGPSSYYASSDLAPRSYNNYRVPSFYPSYNNAAVESSNYAPSYNNLYPRPMGFNNGMAPRYYGINN